MKFKFKYSVVFAAALPLAMAAHIDASYAQAKADHILVNGKVLTVDENFSVAQAIAISGQRITAVGTTAEIRRLAGADTKVTDLGGKTVIPGMIDNHNHYLRGVPTWPLEVRLDTVTSRKLALEMIAAKAKSLQPGEWILTVGGWHPRQFQDDPRPFTQQDLDKAAPNNPVFIQLGFASGVANSLALKAAGVEKNPAPRRPGPPSARPAGRPGGAAGRGASPFGGGFASKIKSAAVPKMTADKWKSFLAKTNRDYNRAGLTAVWDAGGFRGPGARDRKNWTREMVKARGWLGVRLFYPLKLTNPGNLTGGGNVAAMIKAMGNQAGGGNDYLSVLGIGEVNVRTLFDMAGPGFMRPRPGSLPGAVEEFERLAAAAAANRMAVIEHTMIPEKYDLLLTLYEKIDKTTDINPLRWRFDHNYAIRPQDIARAKALGMTLGLHTTSAMAGGAGPRMGADTPPFKTVQASGIVWGLGTDTGIVSPWQPFFTLAFAVTGKNTAGRLVNPNERVSRKEALIAATRSNAYIVGQEKNIGSIEVGKYADIVVLDKDYMTVPDDEIKTIESVLTLVGGNVGYEAKN